MLYFKNDYQEGCATEILQALTKTNEMASIGYGLDEYSLEATKRIKEAIATPNAEVYYLVGGTQTNICAISILRPYEAVIACDTGHINVHECGAIENTGHKVITIPGKAGKIDLAALEATILAHSSFHMVEPKMVYISNSTELGTIYYKEDLIKLRALCDKYHLYLFIDGARLGVALTASSNDLTLPDIAKYSDIFYIGGTKNGALFGEALVIKNENLKSHFQYLMKQRGAVLAKGRLLGIQFNELFKNDLFFKLARHANEMASLLRQVFIKHQIPFYVQNDTNQVFIVVDETFYNKLKDQVAIEIELNLADDKLVLRFVTSFLTKEDDIAALDKLLDNITK